MFLNLVQQCYLFKIEFLNTISINGFLEIKRLLNIGILVPVVYVNKWYYYSLKWTAYFTNQILNVFLVKIYFSTEIPWTLGTVDYHIK